MEEKNKHKVMIGIEVVLLCMLVAILGTNAASSNPPSNGVSYGGNNQTTVEGALNDLYNKANYGNASEGNILSGKTALVGGSKVTGTMVDWTGKPQAIDAVRLANGRFEVAVARGYHNYSWADNSYEYLTYKQVADTIGLTAGKLLKGQTVLGITGTVETGYSSCSSCCPSCPSCPTPESQGYWKVHELNNEKATITSYQTFDGSCKTMAEEKTSGNVYTTLSIELPFDTKDKEIKDYSIVLTSNDRMYVGRTTSNVTVNFTIPNLSFGKSQTFVEYSFPNRDKDSYGRAEVTFSGKSLSIKFSAYCGASPNLCQGNSPIHACGTEFYLSGSITYK